MANDLSVCLSVCLPVFLACLLGKLGLKDSCKKCLELLSGFDSQCIFDDFTQVWGADVLAEFARLQGDVPAQRLLLASRLMYVQLWCRRRNRYCHLTRSHLSSGGTPCGDHSTLNSVRPGFEGKRLIVTLSFTHIIKRLGDFLCIHEHVAACPLIIGLEHGSIFLRQL